MPLLFRLYRSGKQATQFLCIFRSERIHILTGSLGYESGEITFKDRLVKKGERGFKQLLSIVLGGTYLPAVTFCRSASGPGTYAVRHVPPTWTEPSLNSFNMSLSTGLAYL